MNGTNPVALKETSGVAVVKLLALRVTGLAGGSIPAPAPPR
jgi:hypothetical protein